MSEKECEAKDFFDANKNSLYEMVEVHDERKVTTAFMGKVYGRVTSFAKFFLLVAALVTSLKLFGVEVLEWLAR